MVPRYTLEDLNEEDDALRCPCRGSELGRLVSSRSSSPSPAPVRSLQERQWDELHYVWRY